MGLGEGAASVSGQQQHDHMCVHASYGRADGRTEGRTEGRTDGRTCSEFQQVTWLPSKRWATPNSRTLRFSTDEALQAVLERSIER